LDGTGTGSGGYSGRDRERHSKNYANML